MLKGDFETKQTKYTSTRCNEWLTFSIEQSGEAQLVLGRVEGIVQVIGGVGFLQLLILYEVRPKTHTNTQNKVSFSYCMRSGLKHKHTK